MEIKGEIYRISGPVVTALGINARMYDVVKVGSEGLMGEVIGIEGEKTTIQVYEDTSGVKPGEPVIDTGMPLSVELGPGLLESIYDGIQRPLPVLKEKMGDFIQRGVSASGLDHNKRWEFKPVVKKDDKLKGGEIIGTVQETENIEHRILLPPNVSGVVDEINAGTFTVDDVIGRLSDGTELKLMHHWPVRHPRPVKNKLRPTIPLITGQRIFDGLFPLAKGGTAAIPGPFGSGKTVMQQQLAKWSDAEIVVYIGCGERGNEMADVLNEFPELEDPKTGRPLMERTVLIANTSNMPVAAREASVYTGVTIAEYYRDMGYDVSLMADSTSRWAEAMREISSRLEEMPGEEGYPAYLAAKLAEFYERAGRAKTMCGDEGSVTVIGAVSPPGGDFSEPVTQNTLRIVKVFWALDAKLAQRRHFPAINWLTSYSLYGRTLDEWYNENISTEWTKLRSETMSLMQREAELQDIVQLVGSDALPDDQQLTLEIARMVREYFLQQNAYHEVDSYCPMINQYKMLKAILTWGEKAVLSLESGASVANIIALESKDMLAKVRFEKDIDAVLDTVMKKADEEFKSSKTPR
ncbi:MAG: V-type ATP synthase alpha chain [Candidatus Argoarchaeum ethanivorans]|uniref:A-type ATP synthase subunit A n=1 Tax=Candidatus Argoarchaeum ethanivorans TaxID=2608793 RepID=A0A812A095_9EURY|nr:MAG: V-type ATP synthase alpha chain [Candidatus Argoarchaeum ethanivorans]